MSSGYGLQNTGNYGAAKRFRLILREQGQAREMGGSEMSLAVSIVDNIMMQALDAKASDIHMQPERDQLKIRFRVDGILHENGFLPPEQATNVLARLKLYDGRRLSARASCVPCLNGEKFVMRLLDPASMKVNLADLGMPDDIREKWMRAVGVPYGLILVTGPTGSGKTSTLYASLNVLDSKTRNILTVEDPIEYEFDKNIAQVQVTEKMGFPRVMRAFLRQDPDVMMVGEIRDADSLKIGIQAALTGHLVLATIHTNNAIEAIGRMIDMGAEDYLISGVIVGIMAQRLVRRIDQTTAKPFAYSREELEAIGITAADMQGARLVKGEPGESNNGTGFKGRVGLYELVVGDRAFKQAVARRAPYEELLQIAREQGFRSMMEDGKEKVLKGITTPEEVARAVLTQALE